MHDDYKPLLCERSKLARCPVCGSEGSLWQYTTSPMSPRKVLVMCTHGEAIGPQSGLVHEGCLLYMPSDDFYRETERDAIRFWNGFAAALTSLRALAHVPGTELPGFEEVWKKRYEWNGQRGYRIGPDALQQVRFGYEIARSVLIESAAGVKEGGDAQR